MSTPIIYFKRGDTFRLHCQMLADEVFTLSGWGIRSKLRRRTQLIDSFIVTVLSNEEKTFVVQESAPGITQSWPKAELQMDIEYTTPTGMVFSTETIKIQVVEDITYDD